MVTDPAWIAEARRNIGVREVQGSNHEPKILAWWKAIRRGGIKDDETPWCAAFVGGCLEAAGLISTRFESAKSYESWGEHLSGPAYGCIVTFTRAGGGHVGFVVGESAAGDLMVLGGNQGNAVNIRAFSRARATAYRWPTGVPLPASTALPVLTAERSTSEV